ncbi:MAG: CBS domain-containing protein [Spirochaetota bacterium]
MQNTTLLVKDYMTPNPKTIAVSENLMVAENIMMYEGYRHLPVEEEGRIVGVISDRDIKFINYIRGISSRDIIIKDILHRPSYQISPDTPIEEVLESMIQNKYGSAVVVAEEKLLGIFTTIDAMKALKDIATMFRRANEELEPQ